MRIPAHRWLIALCLPLALKVGDSWVIARSQCDEAPTLNPSMLPLTVGRWRGVDQPVPANQIRPLGREAVVQRDFTDQAGHALSAYFIYADQREGLHLPQNCLVSQGWVVVRETTVPFAYGVKPSRPANANLVVAATDSQPALVELYLFADAQNTATGWGSKYLEMIRYGRAGGQMTCLVLLTAKVPRKEPYHETQRLLTDFLAQILPSVQRSLGGVG